MEGSPNQALSGIVARPLNSAVRFEWANLKRPLHNRISLPFSSSFFLSQSLYLSLSLSRLFSLSLSFLGFFFVFFPALYSAGRSVSDTTLLSTLFYCYWPQPATWATFQRRRRLLNDIWVTCSTGQQSWNGTSGTSAHITLMPIPSIPSPPQRVQHLSVSQDIHFATRSTSQAVNSVHPSTQSTLHRPFSVRHCSNLSCHEITRSWQCFDFVPKHKSSPRTWAGRANSGWA